MNKKLPVLLSAFLLLLNIVYTTAQPSFSTKATPTVEGWRYNIAGGADKNYFATYNEKMMQAKEGPLVKYSSSLAMVKTARHKCPVDGKYIGLSGTVTTDKTLALLYADLNVYPGGVFTVSKYIKQNYNPNTLEPEGKYSLLYEDKADGFAGKNVTVTKSKNRAFTAVVITSKKDDKACKVNLINGSNEVYNKKFTYQVDAPEVEIDASTVSVSDNGDIAFMVVDFSVRGDKAYLVVIPAATQEIKVAPLKPGKVTFFSPVITFNKVGEVVVCYNYSNKKKNTLRHGFMLEKYSIKLEQLAQTDFLIPAKLLEQYNEAKEATKDGGIFDLNTTKIHALENGHFVVIAEQIFNDYKNTNIGHSDAMVALGFDENLKPTYQHYLPKFQNRAPYIFYFGNGSAAIGNKVFIFHTGSNHSYKREDGKTKFQCIWFEDGKTEPVTVTLNAPANGLFVNPKNIQAAEPGKFVFPMSDLYEKKNAMIEVTVTDK